MRKIVLILIVISLFAVAGSAPVIADSNGRASVEAETTQPAQTDEASRPPLKEQIPWWGWTILLFVFTFLLGIVAVVAGVGGGVLFVPIVDLLFPFHFDFVRGAGLMVALTGALSASPGLLKKGLSNLRLALPLALVGSICSILGAVVGLSLPTQIVQTALGVAIVGIVVLMFLTKRSAFPEVGKPDRLSQALGIYGLYYEDTLNREVEWKIHRYPLALVFFILIGFLGGMFGLGAGWANVPVLNLVLGAPLKISVGTSILIISVNSPAAAWVYLMRGAVIPMIVAPSVLGTMFGTRLGAKLLSKTRPTVVRWVVIIFLFLAGVRAILSGVGLW